MHTTRCTAGRGENAMNSFLSSGCECAAQFSWLHLGLWFDSGSVFSMSMHTLCIETVPKVANVKCSTRVVSKVGKWFRMRSNQFANQHTSWTQKSLKMIYLSVKIYDFFVFILFFFYFCLFRLTFAVIEIVDSNFCVLCAVLWAGHCRHRFCEFCVWAWVSDWQQKRNSLFRFLRFWCKLVGAFIVQRNYFMMYIFGVYQSRNRHIQTVA